MGKTHKPPLWPTPGHTPTLTPHKNKLAPSPPRESKQGKLFLFSLLPACTGVPIKPCLGKKKKQKHIPQLHLFLKLNSSLYVTLTIRILEGIVHFLHFLNSHSIPLINCIDWFLILPNISNWVSCKNCKIDKKEKKIFKVIISPPRDTHSQYFDGYVFLYISLYTNICIFIEHLCYWSQLPKWSPMIATSWYSHPV